MLLIVVGAVAASAAPLRLGFERDLQPVTLVDATGQPTGFAIELIQAIGAEMQLEVVFVPRSRTEMFADFEAGRIDGLASIVRTRGRDATMAFTVPHLELRSSVFVRRDSPPLRMLEDLRSRRLLGLENSYGHDFLRRRGLADQFEAMPDTRAALHALAEGRGDAMIATRLFGLAIVEHDRLANITTAPLDLPELVYGFHIALHPGDRLRLAQLNEGLARVRANGTYDRLFERWVGPLEPRPLRFNDVQPYLPFGLMILLAILAAFMWQRSVTRRVSHQAEQLRRSEERLRHVLDGSEDGFWDWDIASGRVERSERWMAMLGYAPGEISATIDGGVALVHPEDLPRYEQAHGRMLREPVDRYEIEYRMKAKSGEWRWVLDRGKIVARSPDGRPLRMAGTHSDVTRRKQTEAALFESQALLKRSAQLLEQTQAVALIGGWEIDLRTNRLFWTRETYRIHENTPEDYEPTVETGITFYTPECRPVIRAAVERAIAHGTPFTLELDLVTARGRRIRVLSTGAADKEAGRVVKVYGTFRDITAEKAAEQEREKLRLKMLEAQKLESLGVLAGGIAHDFNNLLTVILANATFVRSSGTREDEPLAHIESAARRAADLCRQMLAYAGKGSFVVERVDLGALVRDTAQLIRVSISKKAQLELTLAPELPAVQADPSQLRQVVMNLVINASEALGETAGKIRIATRLGRPEITPGGLSYLFDLPPGDCVCVEIADTGQGMSPTTLARIFDPFFTTKFAGRGLGLAAVLGIVRAHNGALTVESAPGRGSTFRLFLPATSLGVAPAAGSSSPFSAGANGKARPLSGTILIADDEPIVLATTSAVLRHHGYQTVLAADGDEAVRHFRANPEAFSAVLLDLTMPKLDGAEVLRAIRALKPSTRVLMMSGFSEQDVLARLRGLGEVAILRKPFTQDTLLARLGELARS